MPLLRFIPEATNIDFVGLRYFAFAIDGLLLLISILSIFWLNGFNQGIDFKGGVLMEVKAAHVVQVSEIRRDIIGLGFSDPVVQNVGGGGECDHPVDSCVMIRVLPRQAKSGENPDVIAQQVISTIKAKLGSSY